VLTLISRVYLHVGRCAGVQPTCRLMCRCINYPYPLGGRGGFKAGVTLKYVGKYCEYSEVDDASFHSCSNEVSIT